MKAIIRLVLFVVTLGLISCSSEECYDCTLTNYPCYDCIFRQGDSSWTDLVYLEPHDTISLEQQLLAYDDTLWKRRNIRLSCVVEDTSRAATTEEQCWSEDDATLELAHYTATQAQNNRYVECRQKSGD